MKTYMIASLLAFTGAAMAQQTGGSFNTPFATRLADTDKDGTQIPPQILYTDASYTVQQAGSGTITISYFDNQPVAESQWAEDTNTYTSQYTLKINGAAVGVFYSSHFMSVFADGRKIWASPSYSLTLPITVEPGNLKIEVEAWNPENATAPERAGIKGRFHSVQGQISYSLNLPSDLTNAFQNLQTQIDGLNTRTTALENDVNILNGQMIDIQNRVTKNEGDIVTLQNQVVTLGNQITNLQNQITNNYNELKTLIDVNTAQINQNTTDISTLKNQYTTIDSRVTTIETKLGEINTQITNNRNEYLTLISGLNDRINDTNTGLQATNDKVDTGLQAANDQIRNTNTGLQAVKDQLDQASKNTQTAIDGLKESQNNADKRITELEKRINDGYAANEANQRINDKRYKDTKRNQWLIGGGAALLGISASGVYDHFKTEWEYENFGTPVTDRTSQGDSSSSGGFWFSPTFQPQTQVNPASGGWLTPNH